MSQTQHFELQPFLEVVDGSTLAAISHEILGGKAVAITTVLPVYLQEEVEEAKRVAEEIGIKHILLETNKRAFKRGFR